MQQTMYLHIHQHWFKTRFFNGMQTTVDHVFFGGIHLEGRRAAAGEAFFRHFDEIEAQLFNGEWRLMRKGLIDSKFQLALLKIAIYL
ncbi:Uncharacterised protein [Vibrio cholerae]|uniref:Uncharacterized protein n=1 Tax=Vibrio cholerae TaxID=666 RepID=A0A655X4M4_VIBCL|nr:Uncharacterised protein [Vibrio cholerae]CSA47843.1 Uncharacterised protein [Vibrio cholerae]CSB32734.1 Uncharacterised protein [Vibrio cholerae]CSB61830.1 Uncharacterised protein [Vibrio cholerae]CSB76359.1 Uncharacterised protein [Vibrio cholerae]